MEQHNLSDQQPALLTKEQKDHRLLHSLKWVGFWILVAMLIDLGVLYFEGKDMALEFLGGYLIELSLSMDNLFVFLSIFTAFGISEHAQHRCLNFGIAGAVVLRLVFVLLGVAIVNKFSWVLYVFGAILIFNGVKMFKGDDKEKDVTKSPIMRLIRKFLPMTEDFVGEKFFVKERSTHHLDKLVWHATPLLGVVLLIEFSDILFAIDSVPAVFSVSTHPFIVYTSNIMAILGLRQLYFVLEHLAERFQYVRYGVAVILTFTGVKLLILVFGLHIPIVASILFIFGVLVASIVLSMLLTKKRANAKQE